jgi:hypothetical protein
VADEHWEAVTDERYTGRFEKKRLNMRKILPAMLLLGVLSGLNGCATPRTPVTGPEVAFLAFGDSGYHPDYPSGKELNRPFATEEQWYADYLASLDSKSYGEQEHVLPLLAFNEMTGGYIPASGLVPVSSAMKGICKRRGCDFSLMLGDNIYPNGADGKDDRQRFRDILTGPFGELGEGNESFRIYATLGNHDWKTSRDGALAQAGFMNRTPPFYMDSVFYQVTPPAGAGDIEIFVIDTLLLLATTDVREAELDEWGNEILSGELVEQWPWSMPQNDAEKNMAAWLENALKTSKAKWKIVIGHHPAWSSVGGKFAQSIALRGLIMPTLCKYADAYFSGHEHTLEVHEYDCGEVLQEPVSHPLPQIVSGAAGKQREINIAFRDNQEKSYPGLNTLFARGMVWGFAYASVLGDEMKVDMVQVRADGASTVEYSRVFRHRSP